MKTYGLIGFPLSHSFSHNYFAEKFKHSTISDCEFKNFPLEDINDFSALIKSNPTICGLSVTIPHKQSVIKCLDELDESAKEVGAVNCIRIQHPASSIQKLVGYNTDIFGFEKSLMPLLTSYHTHALILGTGGASKAIQYVLRKIKIDYYLVSRMKSQNSISKTYADLNKEIISTHSIIVNTTPLGMFPNINECPPIPYQHLTGQHLLYDLTYNPEESLFLKKGKENDAQIKNGLEMLHLQAEKAWEIWNSPAKNE